MKEKLLFIFIMLIFITLFSNAYAEKTITQNKIKEISVSNKLFSIKLPPETKGTFSVHKTKDGIFIYHNASKKAGFGGFAFGIKAFKNPSEHAVMPGSRKIGELTDKKETLYDIVLLQPTDVQFDYTKEEPASYAILYELGEKVSIQGVKGSLYFKNQGMKGEDLYKEILHKHKKALTEKWNSQKLEKENMSYMYNVLAQTSKNVQNKTGYAYYDVNGDGVEELFIGEIVNGSLKGVIYDIYTMVERKPAHVVSGGSRNRYFVCDEAFICNEYSSGALENGWLVYFLEENSTTLFPQVGFKYDGYKNKKNPWFISYNFMNNEWENVSETKFKERKATFSKYLKFDYIPFSKVK